MARAIEPRGLAGEVVRILEPHTEADPAALLLQFLTMAGNLIGRGPHAMAEATRHGLNLFVCLIGLTSKGRKGTALSRIRAPFEGADPEWNSGCVRFGLSSGEGLIWAVRDPIEETKPVKKSGRFTGEYETVVSDQGITDKRLLIVESEFASVLRIMKREGNTLSCTIRNAWDSGTLSVITKNSPAKSTGAHISIIGHVTKDEILRNLDSTEAGNGFGNRFLWACVRRSHVLHEGGNLNPFVLNPIIDRLKEVLKFAQTAGEIQRDPEARAAWAQIYTELSEGKPGLLGAMIARAEAQVLRLSCLYAILDCSNVVKLEHLKAALAVWDYCEASAKFIFGEALGDRSADELLAAIRQAGPEGMTRTGISDYFKRHKSTSEINRVLTQLVNLGLIKRETRDTGGRPVETWVSSAK